MDAVQGSINNGVIPLIRDGLDKSKDKAVKELIKSCYTYKTNFCFVPTISALGFKQPVTNWHAAINSRNLLCNNEINFDSYYLPSVNEPHIYLTNENVNWVTQEIDKGHPGCPTICTSKISGGNNTICASSDYTYYLDVPALAGTTVNWIISSNLQLISSNNSSVTVRGVSYGTIKAKIINSCDADIEIPTITNNIIADQSYAISVNGNTYGYFLGAFQNVANQ